MNREKEELSVGNSTFEDTHKDTVEDPSMSNLSEAPSHGRTSGAEGEQMAGSALSSRTEMVPSGSHLEVTVLDELSGSSNQHDVKLG